MDIYFFGLDKKKFKKDWVIQAQIKQLELKQTVT
jgi:hypothetical protein